MSLNGTLNNFGAVKFLIPKSPIFDTLGTSLESPLNVFSTL